MERRPKVEGPDPFADLAKKIVILEREMAVQRAAIARLKALSEASPVDLSAEEGHRPDGAFDGL